MKFPLLGVAHHQPVSLVHIILGLDVDAIMVEKGHFALVTRHRLPGAACSLYCVTELRHIIRRSKSCLPKRSDIV
jgi:hypothetical protein